MFLRVRMLTENRYSKILKTAGRLTTGRSCRSIFLLLFLLLYSCYAGSQDLTQEKIVAIQKEIDALQSEAKRLGDEAQSILALLARFNVEHRLNEHKMQLLELRKQKTLHDIQTLTQKYGELKDDLKRQNQYLMSRLVQAYKNGQSNYLKMMLQVNNATDLLRSYQYISFLAKDDNRKIAEYRESLAQMESTRIRLEQENRNLSLLQQDSIAVAGEITKTLNEKQKLLSAIQQQRDIHMSALKELQQAARDVQKYFKQENTVVHVQPDPSENTGMNILQKKGSLGWPVAGKVSRTFGIYKHPRFSTTTMSNGIEISAPEGTDVFAVHQGTVVFAEWFKGYGQTVILRHGTHIYSLYAHNSDVLVGRGDTIQAGQIIARVGSTGASSTPGLYFEIRDHDQPLDPMTWLRQ